MLRSQLHFKIHFNCTVQWVLTNIYIHVSATIIKILNSSINTKSLLSVSSHFHTTFSLSKNWSISATRDEMSFLVINIKWVILYILFCVWLLLLSTVFWNSSMLLHISIVYCYLLLNSISLYGNTTFCLTIAGWMMFWCVSSLGILGIKTIENSEFVWSIFSFLLGKYQGVELLNHGLCMLNF